LWPKREEVKGGRRKLLNEQLHNLFTSSNIVRMMKSKGDEMDGARHAECIWSSVGKPEVKEST
jgi:hypothetical protein